MTVKSKTRYGLSVTSHCRNTVFGAITPVGSGGRMILYSMIYADEGKIAAVSSRANR